MIGGAWAVVRTNDRHALQAIAPRPSGQVPDTVVFGDSVSDQARAAYEDEIGADGTLRVIAVPGITTTQLRGMAQDEVARRGTQGPFDQVAFLIGYNDVLQRKDHEASVEDLLAVAGRFRCALWLTLPEHAGGRQGPAAYLDMAAVVRWNQMVTAEVADHGAVRLVTGWQEAVEGDAEGRLLRSDGVHPTPEGERVLAAIVAGALRDTCG